VSRSHAGSILLLLGLALCWGYNWVVMKIGLQDSGPVAFAAMRMMGGAAILTVVLLVLIFLKERPRLAQWIATFVALAGVLIMTFLGGHTSSPQSIAYALCASISWSGGVVITQSLLRRHPGKIDVLVLTTWQMIAGSLVLGLVALFMPEAPLHWTPHLVLAVLYNVGPATAVAFLLWFTLQQRLDANLLSLIVLIVPLVGIGLGWLQLGERPSEPDAIGMLLIMGAITGMVLSQRRRVPAPVVVEN